VRNELPESVPAAAGSSNLFSLLGVRPALGRDFSEADDQRGSAVVMLTWSVFERRLAGVWLRDLYDGRDAVCTAHPKRRLRLKIPLIIHNLGRQACIGFGPLVQEADFTSTWFTLAETKFISISGSK
jgi:hypothetical protein